MSEEDKKARRARAKGLRREIEEAVRKGLADGSLAGAETIKARARLEIEGMAVSLLIEEEIHLA